MFSIFKKSPADKLKKEYGRLLESAMQAQRKGDIRSYSDLTDQAEQVLTKMDALKAKQ